MQDDPKVVSGQVIVQRLIDLSYSIDLEKAEALWTSHAPGASERTQLSATPAKAVSFGVPPLSLALGPVAITLKSGPATASARVRLYDFGIAALSLRLGIDDLSWHGLGCFVNDVDQVVGPGASTDTWDTLIATLRRLVAGALDRPTTKLLQEDYLLVIVDGFERPLTARELLDQVDLVPLLSGEERPLSEGARRDLLRHSFSYHPDDLVVLTWDRAFIYEPRRETDVADVLEIANAQLLEVRAYDEMLDAELPRLRAMVESARRQFYLLAARRYARLARRLHTLVAEVSELAERVDNALQVTEDVYLARVYEAAMELFRVPNVSSAVDRKLASIRATYTALHDEAASSRAEVLEIAIVALIAFEIVLSFL